MVGIRALRKIQFGFEETAGTAVAATQNWRGSGMLEDQREVEFVEEDIGYLSGYDRTNVPKLQAGLSLDATPATFEQLPVILSCAVMSDAAGAADGEGSGKIYTFTFPTTAARTVSTLTWETGDDTQAEEMAYGFAESFAIEGAGGEALNMSATLIGRQVSTSTFESLGTAGIPTVEEINFSKGTLYIDTAGGTIGTTTKATTLIGMTLNVGSGWVPKFTADGELYFGFIQSTMPEVTCDLTFEHNASAAAEIVKFKAETASLIRIKFEGSALATAGTTYTYKTLVIDMAGKWDSFTVIDEQDGNDVVTGTFRARYNATAAKFAEIVVVNEVATLGA